LVTTYFKWKKMPLKPNEPSLTENNASWDAFS
jgi:hypothetical protein